MVTIFPWILFSFAGSLRIISIYIAEVFTSNFTVVTNRKAHFSNNPSLNVLCLLNFMQIDPKRCNAPF